MKNAHLIYLGISVLGLSEDMQDSQKLCGLNSRDEQENRLASLPRLGGGGRKLPVSASCREVLL